MSQSKIARTRPPAAGLNFGYALILFGLTGCSSSPSQNILGSFFPSWMLCALAGIGMTIIVHRIFIASKLDTAIPIPLVVYLSLSVAFAFATWIIWLA